MAPLPVQPSLRRIKRFGVRAVILEFPAEISTGNLQPPEPHLGLRLTKRGTHEEQNQARRPLSAACRTSARMSALGRIRSWPRVYGTTQKLQNSLQPSMIVT